ncbi:DUF1778 domain-containing protein [Geobacter sp.]|uniref:type II toxin-antitoxin system TacA family antitoxin n=1 Tax=Geobacter sp. TaxID=46610 RepID=UPI0026043CBD|nr:DUF1778 domain-containing protein [Geobacter sp.]
MALAKTEERIPARMPHAVYERISEAAQAVGATLNQFLVQAALEKANEILEQERIIALSTKAAKTVFDLIENPPEPNERLKKALKRREDLLCRK